MPSGPNAENAKDLYDKAKSFHNSLKFVSQPIGGALSSADYRADEAFNDMSSRGMVPGYAPRTSMDALGLVGTDTSPVEDNALSHEDIDRIFNRYIGDPERGSFMESSRRAEHARLDAVNAPKYSDRVKARRQERP